HVAEGLQKRSHVVIRPADIKHFDEECKKIWTVYNRAWEKNWGFVPMTEAEFAHLAKNLRQVVVPELTLVAEVGIRPIGFSLALPDMNQALIKINGRLFPFGLLKLLWHTKVRNCINQVRIITMGVIEEYRNRGIDAAFYYHTWKNANRLGYYQGEMSWILENNTMMNRSAEMLGARIYRTYRMFEMNI
ncbi:N-acetyltransferase, partial [bacterium]|nr:N-acetyltransferase [bacterium]